MDSIYERVDQIRESGSQATADGRISCSDFKNMIRQAHSEIEVRRLFHWHYESLTGTPSEIVQAIAFADRRAEELANAEEGVPVFAVAAA